MSYGYDDESKRKRRYIVITISSVLLISMVVAVTVGVSLNKHDGDSKGKAEVNASVKAVKDVCAPTDYRKTCEDTLIKNGKNTTDPMELVKTAFNVTMKQITDAAKKSQTIMELQKDSRTRMALDQCKELMDYALDELSNSFEELGKFEFHLLDEALINLRIWLSAAISHEETCLEGFQGTQGNAGETMKKALKTAIELTHNGLAIISEMSNFVGQMQIPGLNSRRLLAEGFPSWVDQRGRKLLQAAAAYSDVKPDIVVAQDGSGQYKTINEALQFVPKKRNTTFVVHIKAGLYKEYVQVNKTMSHLVFIGDGPDKTIISGNKNYKDGITTYRTATVAIVGNYFIAKNIGFENTAGAIKHQAVAVRVQSDESIFFNCRFDGYQDTLYTHSHRQFFRDCTISGTIDFLFGDAAAVFQNCTLLVRKPLPNQACPITAHGRKDPRESTGFVFQGCTIAGEPDYLAVKETSKAYLGRPWKEYSRTIIMNTFIPDFVQPQGWQPWLGDFGLKTLFYSEVQNTGPGSALANRVTWAGIKTLSEEDILKFTPAQYIQGDDWIPGKGVPYTTGLLAGNPAAATTTPSVSAAAPGFSTFTDTSGADSIAPTASPAASPESSISMAYTGTASPESSIKVSSSTETASPESSFTEASTASPESSIMVASTESSGSFFSMFT
ncbi:putative pectinesterase [Arabidopsis thaliana]|uniref:Probable pectinesterase/pectinesterase inhibitor 21 n=1 Tax=Arabidopsis thaliana TaxID=3702 RepID=PME21_ARATH|nr:Plant invertase/pectin methylesterase inhibitor superfamily [Arabidopsis thaliana]Q8GX86.2 RecName: Full=Probable pectinesterase/pectinesterase inhibitor 21; Includes: RecName: Full=Pectinesterase inhibitor 21; AltName: Full=Pectin methylesterase inhibitor 21; Includes: RecName: Full=Pectinesterase 21; Short=PE 21; AltName: Full=Pectin methylesterase 21; Short=AtPME21 [Arabidopsis thaliana]AAF26136.1 putative pectinesterase [Arabidopsis thaliana]AEE74266.1 Plant invertase/pectin methylesteras|eukprot:NP_187212.1 Plant invertase/pectin methylesterase inhibitor superfamily [Arabidopsis thaliana]